jgi:cobalamin biosynthesis protein CobT
MKTIVLSVALALGFVSATPVFAAAEIKEVCKDKKDKAGKVVVDKKTNKPAQECKKIKVHKKLEGTKVPEKK